MTTDELIKQYKLTVTGYDDGWTVNDPHSGYDNKSWPLVTGRPTKAKAVRDAVKYLKHAEKKYRYCTECGFSLSEEEYGDNRRRMQGSTCGPKCTQRQIIRYHACCEKASLYPCVCMYAFTCPKHGMMHIGTHD